MVGICYKICGILSGDRDSQDALIAAYIQDNLLVEIMRLQILQPAVIPFVLVVQFGVDVVVA